MTREDLQLLSELRLKEAQLLLQLGSPSGAYYLAGYAVECALKACIAKSTQRYEFPDKARVDKSHSHKLTQLIEVAGLKFEHDAQCRADANFERAWSIVNAWSEATRYSEWTQARAESLLDAIANPAHGVLQWITARW